MANNFFELETPDPSIELYDTLTATQETSKFEGYVAGIKAGFRNNISSMLFDAARSAAGSERRGGQMLSPEEANEEFEPSIPFTEPVSRTDAMIRKEREMFLQEQEAIMRESGLGGFGRFTSSFLGGMADPATITASMLTAGFGGAAARSIISAGTYAKTARALKALSGSKNGSILAQELAESAVVAAALEIPVAENIENVYGENFGVKEHLFNIATGTAAGTLMRIVGRTFTKSKSRPTEVDKDAIVNVVTRELDESATTGKAPDIEKALEADRKLIAEKASDPVEINQSAKNLESEGGDDGIVYSTHRVGADNLVKEQVKYGTDLGDDGVNAVSNPALAQLKGKHLPEIEVVKYDANKLNLLDLEDAVPDDFRKKFIATEVPAPIANKIARENYGSLKRALQYISEWTQDKPESKLSNRANAWFKNNGYDGYRFKEEFFEADEAISEGTFLFANPKKLEEAVISRHTIDETNRPKDKAIEVEEEAARPIEELMAEPRNQMPDDNPAYNPQFQKALDEAFDEGVINAPETEASEMIEQINQMMEQIKENEALIKKLEEDSVPSKYDKIIEEGQKDITEAETSTKASIACGRKNT